MIVNSRYYILIVFAFFITPAFSQVQIEKDKLSITKFKRGPKVSREEFEIFQNKFRDKLDALGLYQISKRQSVEMVYENNSEDFRGCMAKDCAIQLGKHLEADKVLDGIIRKQDEKYSVKFYILDMKTKRVEFQDNFVFSDFDNFDNSLNTSANNLKAHTFQLPWEKQKTRWPFIWRSGVFSGWGQYYEGDTKKGSLFMGIGAILLGNYIYSYKNYQNAGKDYESTLTIPYIASDAAILFNYYTLKPKKDRLDNSKNYMNNSLYLLVGFWIWNIVDVTFFEYSGSNLSFQIDYKPNFISDNSFYSKQDFGDINFSLSIRF